MARSQKKITNYNKGGSKSTALIGSYTDRDTCPAVDVSIALNGVFPNSLNVREMEYMSQGNNKIREDVADMRMQEKKSESSPEIEDINDLVTSFRGTGGTLSDAELESRLNAISKEILLFRILIPIILVAASVGFILIIKSESFLKAFIIIILGLIICGVLFLRMHLQQIEIKRLVGNNVVSGVLAEVFELSEYAPLRFIGNDQIKAASLINSNWHVNSGSNFIQGKCKDINFTLSDIHLEELESDVDGNQRSSTVFKGQWLILDLNKSVEKSLYLRARKKNEKGLKSDLETANIDFNNKFQILADDPETAISILTPHFMEYFVSAENQPNTRIRMRFMGNKAYIAVENKRDLFNTDAIKILGGTRVAKLREQIGREIQYIIDMIAALSQNTYLFPPVFGQKK